MSRGRLVVVTGRAGRPGRLSHKRVFPGEGIMIEVSFAVATIQLRSGTCRYRDLATILADNADLLQTLAVAEPTEVGLS